MRAGKPTMACTSRASFSMKPRQVLATRLTWRICMLPSRISTLLLHSAVPARPRRLVPKQRTPTPTPQRAAQLHRHQPLLQLLPAHRPLRPRRLSQLPRRLRRRVLGHRNRRMTTALQPALEHLTIPKSMAPRAMALRHQHPQTQKANLHPRRHLHPRHPKASLQDPRPHHRHRPPPANRANKTATSARRSISAHQRCSAEQQATVSFGRTQART